MLGRKLRGFTLIELMVVVFIIGVLAAVAIPVVSKYLRKSKTAEASLNLRKIYDGEIAYYQEEKTTSAGAVISKQFIAQPRTPATPGKDKVVGNFEAESWRAIRFTPDGPVQFAYTVITSGLGTDASFTARAEGDIDGDGTFSLFERVANVDTVSGEVLGGAAIFTLDELE